VEQWILYSFMTQAVIVHVSCYAGRENDEDSVSNCCTKLFLRHVQKECCFNSVNSLLLCQEREILAFLMLLHIWHWRH